LTGLNNYRCFSQRLQVEVAAARQKHYPLSILLIALDDDKDLHRTLGRNGLDSLLSAFASVLKNSARETDVLARYGDEVFGVILPHAGEAEAATVAARHQQAVEQIQIDHLKRGVSTTFVVATFPVEAGNEDALIQLAEDRLFGSKNLRPAPSGLAEGV
jgi:two-component system cell cycle response regulator